MNRHWLGNCSSKLTVKHGSLPERTTSTNAWFQLQSAPLKLWWCKYFHARCPTPTILCTSLTPKNSPGFLPTQKRKRWYKRWHSPDKQPEGSATLGTESPHCLFPLAIANYFKHLNPSTWMPLKLKWLTVGFCWKVQYKYNQQSHPKAFALNRVMLL